VARDKNVSGNYNVSLSWSNPFATNSSRCWMRKSNP